MLIIINLQNNLINLQDLVWVMTLLVEKLKAKLMPNIGFKEGEDSNKTNNEIVLKIKKIIKMKRLLLRETEIII